MHTRMLGLHLKSIDRSARAVDCIASTDTIDSYGEIVAQNWRLDRYKSNPVVLYAHNSRELPIGHAENVRVENGALCARLVFSSAEANPKGEQVWRCVLERTLRAVSVGFVPATIRDELRDGRSVTVLDDCELHEISVVPVPANPDAVMRGAGHAGTKRTSVTPSTQTPAVDLGDYFDAATPDGDGVSEQAAAAARDDRVALARIEDHHAAIAKSRREQRDERISAGDALGELYERKPMARTEGDLDLGDLMGEE